MLYIVLQTNIVGTVQESAPDWAFSVKIVEDIVVSQMYGMHTATIAVL